MEADAAVELDWVTSAGGPLIVMPESVCGVWTGAPPDYPDDEGDYGRACAVDGYLGVIDVGGAEALVLGDEPAMTTFLPELDVFVRAAALDDDVDVEAAVAASLPTAPWTETVAWAVTEPVVLFDSVYSGPQIGKEEHQHLVLAPGKYTVEAAYFEIPGACLILVRLTHEGG